MSVIDFAEEQPNIYVILGIDEFENDRVLAVCSCYDRAKKYCAEFLCETDFYDVWMEKHTVL